MSLTTAPTSPRPSPPNFPPPELLTRILLHPAFTHPPSLLACLLVNKRWSTTLSTRERCLIKHNFTHNPQGLPPRDGFNNKRWGTGQGLDGDAYLFWEELEVAALKDEFGWLGLMQSELREMVETTGSRATHPNTAKNESQWKQLTADVNLLTEPFRALNVIKSYRERYARDARKFCFLLREEGAMICPLLLAPVPELDSVTTSTTQPLLKTLLSRLRVSEHLCERYTLWRIPVWDEQITKAFIRNKRIWCYDTSVNKPPALCTDVHAISLYKDVYQALKDADVVELIHVEKPDQILEYWEEEEEEEEEEEDGYPCWFTLCRRREKGRSVLGWMVYDNLSS
ncbi:uncharacterized protein EV422DRAFT_97068 [Fimicolochytrium jonesii]|uniref:uncharacterized protein n=1 Tax=Fimicolochytrium jonesii TaxID=1396493 RepID=UPI0022FEA192|nr:uncharacterized protein EV422DRAFT_97068 [Fimicolochytrium jonesii]KAI8819559.1 hypothetical protein EV422DRAFT_97068 [Fimicolochytrium jonesii]